MVDIGQTVSDKVESIASDLHKRITIETERILREQLKKIGLADKSLDKGMRDVVRIDHVDDDFKLATYLYKGRPILGVRAGENMMSIEFVEYDVREK